MNPRASSDPCINPQAGQRLESGAGRDLVTYLVRKRLPKTVFVVETIDGEEFQVQYTVREWQNKWIAINGAKALASVKAPEARS